MVLASLVRLSTLINRTHIRKYYSNSVKSLFLNNFNKYEQHFNEKDNDSKNLQFLLNDYKTLSKSINDVENELTNKSDTELWNMMNDEKIQLEVEKSDLIDSILNEIYNYEQAKDAHRIPKNSSCLIEISAGVGGKEAQLFAHELCGMYSNYFNYKNWTVNDEHSDVEGDYLRHYKAKIEGKNVWEHLKYETGVHRVQRIPKTETRGRQAAF
jgi:peptide chain release factor 1